MSNVFAYQSPTHKNVIYLYDTVKLENKLPALYKNGGRVVIFGEEFAPEFITKHISNGGSIEVV